MSEQNLRPMAVSEPLGAPPLSAPLPAAPQEISTQPPHMKPDAHITRHEELLALYVETLQAARVNVVHVEPASWTNESEITVAGGIREGLEAYTILRDGGALSEPDGAALAGIRIPHETIADKFRTSCVVLQLRFE